MSAFLSGSRVILEGDGMGWQMARTNLPPAPLSADGMIFAYRAWFDSFTGSGQESVAPGWDSTFAFGLTFNNTLPAFNTRANFFGLATAPAANSPFDGTLVYNVNVAPDYHSMVYYASNAPGYNSWCYSTFWPGTSASQSNITPTDVSLVGYPYDHCSLPYQPNIGATFSGIWVIKKSVSNNTALTYSLGYNMSTLSNILSAFADGGTVWYVSNNTFTDTSNWRAGGGLNVPTQFVAKMPSYSPGRKLVIDKIDVQYFSF